MFWIDFNGQKNTDLDVQIIQRPNVPVPVRRVKYFTIPGRNGTLTETDNTYEDIRINVQMNYLSSEDDDFMDVARSIKKWLTGSGELKMSDDLDTFYRVKNVSIPADIERVLRRAGIFTALFDCDPFTYYESGKSPIPVSQAKTNPYLESQPVYIIQGEGLCTLTVNGNQMIANVGQNFILDTELMMTYREDKTLQKAENRFDYEDFHLQNGENSISVSSGFNLQIKPNWRSL